MKNILESKNNREYLFDKAVKRFGLFLSLNWGLINEALDESIFKEDRDSIEDWMQDWLQANWELIITHLNCLDNEFLQDYLPNPYRFYVPKPFKNKTEGFELYCSKLISGEIYDVVSNKIVENFENMDFVKFVGIKDGEVGDFPPFDYVMLEGNDLDFYTVRQEDVFFKLRAG
ncbi:hypothetical protein [Tenacibaculum maritimum]|uniref:hypothetical protein n=1 Tax=Tenacibaculum maritimum TaxID=107401 RepID=UPI0012E64A59|nr:hypothetical protein [Tenacibaculum maritimum]MCD9564342.1 hypothetical protein [Tenacibaculum maritimum]MCD9567176.1 hypothetical protein [Tenacibaculum maritimum]MCD9579127.1 hypothetical protein [Tenacibaculum maritimum]MCD9598159.1 hypothetical protein [Tenacibaculum maritimum]MCD9614995.1 hypothetical protein [Tenacibaculum maritimum]